MRVALGNHRAVRADVLLHRALANNCGPHRRRHNRLCLSHRWSSQVKFPFLTLCRTFSLGWSEVR